MIVRKERYQALAPNRFVLMEWGNRYIGSWSYPRGSKHHLRGGMRYSHISEWMFSLALVRIIMEFWG